MAFCKEYNARTAGMAGQTVPVEITCFDVSTLPTAHSDAYWCCVVFRCEYLPTAHSDAYWCCAVFRCDYLPTAHTGAVLSVLCCAVLCSKPSSQFHDLAKLPRALHEYCA
jgi:hypothetical protein